MIGITFINTGVKRFLMGLFNLPCRFYLGATKPVDIVSGPIPEVAFIGRSNVGKSSLINALVNQKKLANTSHTPGRTQQINYFLLGEKLFLVDMPGYGYAKASKQAIKRWNAFNEHYLNESGNLRRLFILIDARHGIKKEDFPLMEYCDEVGISYQIVLTKTDKTKTLELQALLAEITARLKLHPACIPEVLTTSSHKKDGVRLLQKTILECMK